MAETNWAPERKIIAAAIATIVMWGVQSFIPAIDVPPGIEAAIAVIVGYLIPNPK